MNDLAKTPLSPARKLALKKLFENRRGVRINKGTISDRERETTLSEVIEQTRKREPLVRSMAALATFLRVDPKTVARWLRGEHWPTDSKIIRMQQWLNQLPK